VNVIERIPEATPFLRAVSITDHPDYLSTVNSPIDLSIIKERARHGEYQNIQALREDITLLRDNCHQYCKDLYPDLVLLADSLLEEFHLLTECFGKDLVESVATNVNDTEDFLTTTLNEVAINLDSRTLMEEWSSAIKTAPVGSATKGVPLLQELPKEGSVFTVCMRVGCAPEASVEFLVPISKYLSLQSHYHLNQRVVLLEDSNNSDEMKNLVCLSYTENPS
jgi:hypothetical protein